ncbi:glycosyltransferase family 2 protein [Sphingobacterium pedocola]|uniref:Glycosyl transferase family 2 n=1 Tax=Sphingobacterium pedocola TaxID=2082722 RepID=A0ABR9TAG0_9SPHI|nr:glycosyltransferase family 2 protein [Sphingobacterium pedocola]MBE8722318.1 glycosyl transferase family 2 [Sphingobacterium pedocola]
MENCTLLISTYNWPQALDLCLQSVMKQSKLPKEIVIADDGSDRDTAEIIDKYRIVNKVPIKHVWQEDLGFRKSLIMNKAVKGASYEYIVQIDGDVILNRNFIEDHLIVAERSTFVRGTRAHIRKEYVQEMFLNSQSDFKFYSKGIKNRFNAIRLPSLSWLVSKRELSGRSVRGCNMAFWKTDFVQVNGYNNDLKGWGHEDEELATRLVNNGIIKKSVKFRCIQYHIFHPLASRELENIHDDLLFDVRNNKIIRCENGYENSFYK